MPGSIVTSPAVDVEKNAASEPAHANGHCSLAVADGLDSKVAGIRETVVSDCAATVASNTRKESNGDPSSGDDTKENGHAPDCPEKAREGAQEETHRAPEDAEPEGGDETPSSARNCTTHASGRSEASEEKSTTPETTPAGSDEPTDSPCQAQESGHSKDDTSPAMSKHAENPDHSPAVRAQVSAKSNGEMSEDAAHSDDRSIAKVDAEEGVDDAASASSERPQRGGVGAAGHAERSACGPSSPHASVPSEKECEKKNMRATLVEARAHSPSAEAELKPSTSSDQGDNDERGQDFNGDDEQLVASLIAAAAGNSVRATMPDDGADVPMEGCSFALSDSEPLSKVLAAPSSEHNDDLSRHKSDEVTGSENGNDDDEDEDDAVTAQGSSTRPDAGSDVDDMDDDSKKDSRGARVPGKRSQKKKKDKDKKESGAENKGAGDDKDEEVDEDGELSKSARKSKKDADADEPRPKGRKGKKQDGDAGDRNLSREERKMQWIQRQIEQMEQREKAKAGPSTPRADGRGGERNEDIMETDTPSSHRKRKETEDDDAAGVRKKPKGVEDDKAASSPCPAEVGVEIQAAPKSRGRPPGQKMTGKQKIRAEKEAGGMLATLRSYKSSIDSPTLCLPRKASFPEYTPCLSLANEYAAVQKSLRFAGKKSYCWIQAALADLAEHEPYTRGAPEWLPTSHKARLNPHRRMIDKKRFPAIKSCLAKWTYECAVMEKASAAAATTRLKAGDVTRLTEEVHVKPTVKLEHGDEDVAMKDSETALSADIKAEPANEPKIKAEERAEASATADLLSASVKTEDAEDAVRMENSAEGTKAAMAAATSSTGTTAASSTSSSKSEIRIPRRDPQHAGSDRFEHDRHGLPGSLSSYPASDRMGFRDSHAGGQRITTGYGSLAISIPVGGSQHSSQYSWDQRARSSEASPLMKNDPSGSDFGGSREPRWQRGAESPGMWMGKRDPPGPPPISGPGPNSPTKVAGTSSADSAWDRGRDRSEGRATKGDCAQDSRWQRGKDGPGHWMGKRDGSGPPPMPSSPRVGDPPGNWGPRSSARTSAWDQPPSQSELLRESKDAAMPDREMDRSSAIRNLPDMREMRREPSPLPMRRRVPTPPRSMYGGEMRDRGMDMGGGSGGGGGGSSGNSGNSGNSGSNSGGGGLSRESLRREREDALLRDREPLNREPLIREPPEREPPRFIRSEIVRSEIVRSEIRSNVPERASDSPRSRGILNQWDLGPRARSPRPLDRAMERPPIRAISPPGRDRSLSPRSKEVQREMQALRERRSDRKDEWGRDIPEGRRDGSECSPGPDDRDMPPRQMLGGLGGAGRGGGWWGGSGGRGGRGGGPAVDDRPPPGIVRRQRPSMFAARRPREDGYSNSPPRNR